MKDRKKYAALLEKGQEKGNHEGGYVRRNIQTRRGRQEGGRQHGKVREGASEESLCASFLLWAIREDPQRRRP